LVPQAQELRLDQLVVLYPGPTAYPIADRVRAVPLSALAEGPRGLLGRRG
jgi:hypothetical protein